MPVQGVVKATYQKPFTDQKTGVPIVLHSFQLVGNNTYFRTGTNAPTFQQGQMISFEVTGNNNVPLNSVTIMENAPGPVQNAPQAAAQAPSRANGGTSRDGYWSQKEARDIEREQRYQSVDIPRMTFSAVQDRAIELVGIALQHDCLSLGQTKAKKLDVLMEAVQDVTNTLFLQAMHAHDRLDYLENRPEDGEEYPSQPDFNEE